MPVQPQLTPDWKRLEGSILEGGYEVEHCLAASSQTALFRVRILGDRFTSASAKVWAPQVLSPGQTADLQQIKSLRHPGISHPLSSGTLHVDSEEFPFLVLKTPDETLDGVLQERALTAEEALQMTRSVVDALTFLHAAGYVHGAISPETVFAVDESIQLASSSLQPSGAPLRPGSELARYAAPESPEANVTPAADVFCLGSTVWEVLTRKPFTSHSRTEASGLSAPLRALVLRATDEEPGSRASLNELQTILRGDVSTPAWQSMGAPSPTQNSGSQTPLAVAQLVAEPQQTLPLSEDRGPVINAGPVPLPASLSTALPAAAPPVETKLAPIETKPPAAPAPQPQEPAAHAHMFREVPAPTPQPLPQAPQKPFVIGSSAPAGDAVNTVIQPVATPAAHNESSAPEPRGRRSREAPVSPFVQWRGPIFIAVAVLLVALVVWLLRPHRADPPPAAEAPVASQSPAAVPTATPPANPIAPKPALTASAPLPVTRRTVSDHANANWRVVAFTFNREKDAEKRASSVRNKHPALDPAIFSPSGSGAPYLVVLGGRMTREDAQRLKAKARANGLPRDTYVQNYNR